MVKRSEDRIVTTDEDIDAAIAAGRSSVFPAAIQATYAKSKDVVIILFEDGIVVHIPRKLLQGLEHAKPAQLSTIVIEGPGTGIVWPSLDVAHYIPDLITGIFGTRKWMTELGRRGGKATSSAKAAAARANGAKGGRPRSGRGRAA